MPRDTWEENSACEIGTLCLRLPHPVGRQQAHHEQKHDPRTVSLTLAHQGPMTEGVPINRDAEDQRRSFRPRTGKSARSPLPHHKYLKSTNMLERLNQELKRRTHVVRIFPNAESCLRLVRALAAEMHENWSNAISTWTIGRSRRKRLCGPWPPDGGRARRRCATRGSAPPRAHHQPGPFCRT